MSWKKAIVVVAAGALAGHVVPAKAQFVVNASFRNTTAPGWSIPKVDNASTVDDSNILTGGYGAISDTNTNDANGSGWLRLTTKRQNQAGVSLYTGSGFPSSSGVLLEFDYVSWGGVASNGADGISAFLYDANGSMAGAKPGASLGFCHGNGGYLAVALDEFGNFSSDARTVTDACTGITPHGATRQPQSIAIRGPVGSGNPYVAGLTLPGGQTLDVTGVTSRPTTNRRVRLVLVPKGSGTGYRVNVFYGATPETMTQLISNQDFAYAAPANLRLGFGGSTGGYVNVHEVREVFVRAPADLVVTKQVSTPQAAKGDRLSYTVTLTNKDINAVDAGNQAPTITPANAALFSDSLPSQLRDATWTCSASSGSTCPAASGTGSISTSNYTLAPGGVLTFSITGYVTDSAQCNATVSNTAAAVFPASSGFSDMNPDDNSATANFTVLCPAPFATCPTDAFVTRDSNLYTMDLSTGAMSLLGTSGPLANSGVNGIGFRQQDGYLWGYYKGTGAGDVPRLVRIGQNGVADLPFAAAPGGLGFSGQFVVADIQPGTGYYAAANAGSLYYINVATNAVVGSPVATTAFAQSSDMAFHPTDGNIYGVNNTTGVLFRVNSATGAKVDLPLALPLSPGSGGWGGIFFDSAGTMYAYRSGATTPPGLVYRIFNVSGSGGAMFYDVLAPNAPTSSNLDGARCPAAPPPALPPVIALSKTTTGATGGPFSFALTNTRTHASGQVTTTTAGTPTQVDADGNAANGVQPYTVDVTAQAVTISETVAPGWRLASATCRNSQGTVLGALNGSTYTLPAGALATSQVYQCEFVNERSDVDLYITKTNNAAAVVPGTPFDYTLVIGNKGPQPADGAVVRDPAVAGLACSALTCTSTGGASCPTPLTVAALQSTTGLTIPGLPKDSSVELKLRCSAD
jgi:uncharacterized repeat protein (TIGR01451 family)